MMASLFEKYSENLDDDLDLQASIKACGGIMYAGEHYSLVCNKRVAELT